MVQEFELGILVTFTIFLVFLQQLHTNMEISTHPLTQASYKGECDCPLLSLIGFLPLLNLLWPVMYYIFATLEH